MSPARKAPKKAKSAKPAKRSPKARPAKRAAAKTRPAKALKPKAAKAGGKPGRRHCSAMDPFGGPCQSAPRPGSTHCTIHSYLDR